MKKLHLVSILTLVSSLFSFCDAQYTTLHSFGGLDGAIPYSSLTLSGNKLFGMTITGGAYNYGCIFSMDTLGHNYKDVHDFDSIHGGQPFGALTLSRSKLYGLTSLGGTHDSDGVLFSVDTTGNNYKVLLNFDGANGAGPGASLTLSGYKLYGMTAGGGANNLGLIFSIDTNGGAYKDMLDFNGANGQYPEGNFTLSGHKLYGMTAGGGANNLGLIFSIDTNGAAYKDMFDFNGTSGASPGVALTLSGNKLYGMAVSGGANDTGCVFSIDTNGSSYKDIHDFNDTDGASPYGGLALYKGQLYGMTPFGGTYGVGNAFSIDTNGSNFNNMFSFSPININTGFLPFGSFTISASGKLYGMAEDGGYYGAGIVFSYGGCANTFVQPICIVTFDTSTNFTEVIWGRNSSPPAGGYGSYNIYKDTSAGFHLYGSTQLNALSEFTDTVIASGPVSYELSTVDSCGESALSAPQTSVYLSVTLGINSNTLNWTPYAGFTPTQYIIFRGLSQNTLVKLDSVANSIFTYTDSHPPIGAVYAVEAVSPNGACIPTTHGPNRRLMAALSGSFSNGVNTKLLGVQQVGTAISKLNIYPNPSSGIFTVNYSLNSPGNVRTTVVNELGQVVYDNTAQKNEGNITGQLNLENIASGIYSLRIQTDNTIIVRKMALVKNN